MRGELAGLKWEDVNFEKLYVDVTRSVVDQQVGNTKTKVSRKPIPIDSYLAKDLLMWHEQTPYRKLSDWVFATDSRRAGAKRGKQPLWLSTLKVVQELLRQASARMTLDTYSQALTPAKRAAQSKMVSMIRPKSTCTVDVPRVLDRIGVSG